MGGWKDLPSNYSHYSSIQRRKDDSMPEPYLRNQTGFTLTTPNPACSIPYVPSIFYTLQIKNPKTMSLSAPYPL